MTHALELGSLLLTGDKSFADPVHGYWFEVATEGTDFGNTEAALRTITSLLSDGDLVAYDRDGNRVVPVKVQVCGPTLAAVAQGEAALRRATKQSNLLTWQPPDNFAPASVFETFPSPMPRSYDAGWDLDEAKRCYRSFRLELTCAPFARSVDLTTSPALVAGTTTVVINAGTSTTGWSGFSYDSSGNETSTTVTTTSGAVQTTSPVSSVASVLTLALSSTSMASTRYLLVDSEITLGPGTGQVEYRVVGSSAWKSTTLVATRAISANRVLYVLDTAGASIDGVRFRRNSIGANGSAAIRVYDVSRSDAIPQVTSRQFSRIIEVGGTERTPASIHVSAPDGTTDLGLTIVSTYPGKYPEAGFHPAMSRWYTSGTRTSDATTVSGYRYRLNDGFFVATAPASSFPEGGYQMSALIAAATEGDYEVVSLVQTRKAGVILKEWSNNTVAHLSPAPNWGLVDLGVPTLPILRAESGTDVVLAVKVRQTSGADTTVVVEAQDSWMLPVDDDCGLTVVLSDKSNLWIDSPSLENNGVPRVFEGDAADRSGATYPLRGVSGGRHILSAGTTGLTVITSVTEYPATEATYYKRWLHNAAE